MCVLCSGWGHLGGFLLNLLEVVLVIKLHKVDSDSLTSLFFPIQCELLCWKPAVKTEERILKNAVEANTLRAYYAEFVSCCSLTRHSIAGSGSLLIQFYESIHCLFIWKIPQSIPLTTYKKNEWVICQRLLKWHLTVKEYQQQAHG